MCYFGFLNVDARFVVLLMCSRWQQRHPLHWFCRQRFCELLAMKMNDWEQIRLFLGDLHLVHHERGKRATWLIERDVKKKNNPWKQDKWQRTKSAVVLFVNSGWIVMIWGKSLELRMESKVQCLIWTIFLHHWKRQSKMRLVGVVATPGSVSHTVLS